VKAPKFSAYIASKTALDTWSRIVGRELYADGVTFTNLRLPLVRTDMIGPTDTYANAPALSAEQAAARVVRALEDRPLTVNTVAGTLAEVINLVAPRASDALQWAIAKRFPDSVAAVGAGAETSAAVGVPEPPGRGPRNRRT
jgi:short-subunit dehydrogenase